MPERTAANQRIYDDIKTRVLSGVYGPSDHLPVTDFCDAFNASLTPVRTVLFMLAGERLVDHHPNGGFYMPRLTEPGLRNLYSLNETILLQSVRQRRVPVTAAIAQAEWNQAGDDIIALTEQTFLRIAGLSENEAFINVLANVNDRLHPMRRRKNGLIDRADEELAGLRDALDRQAFRNLEKAIASYHRRRRAIVPDIVRRMHEPLRASTAC